MSALRPEKFIWGYLGCGDVCERKSAPAAFTSSGADVSVGAVMRRSLNEAQKFAERHNVRVACSSVDQLIGPESPVNAVYIATPPVHHKENALECIDKGIKYIYIEKPVCFNAKDARVIKARAEEAGASVVVAHYRNELPMYKEVETILKDGLLGHIKSVNIRIWQAKGGSDGGWRVDPAVSGGGYFHDLAPHVLALMYKWFGSFHNARGQQLKSEGNIVDQVTGMATFDNSIQFTASWCFSVPPCQEVDECLIVGQYGSLRVPFFKGSHFDLNLDDSDGRKTHYEYEHPYNIQQPFIHAMMTAFRGRTDIPCSIDDAIAVMDVMDAFAQD